MTNPKFPTRKIAICMDTPGWGGAEYDLGRLVSAGALRPDMLLISPQADSRLLELGRRFDLKLVRHHCANRLSGLTRGLLAAARLRSAYPDTLWIFWCHHVDSNRWLQFGFALLGGDFVLSERICANSRREFRHSLLSIPLKHFAASASRSVVLCGYGQPNLFTKIFGLRPGIATTIPNSRDIRKIAEAVQAGRLEAACLRTKHGFGSAPVFFCSGRLAPEKNFKAAILAFQRFIADGGCGNLVIAGEGPERDQLLAVAGKFANERIHLIGYQSNIIPWLAVSSVFILPSYGEGLSGALIEAMASGLPCLVSDITGNRELVIPGETGLMFHADDHGQLARSMALVCENGEFASRMGRAAYDLVLRKYDAAVETERWRSLIDYAASLHQVI